MKKRIVLLVSLSLLLICGVLVGIFWDPIIDWLPIDQSGWDMLDNGGKCYLDEDGDPVTGWQELENNIYYFDPESCAMQIRWLQLEDGRYFLGDDGIRQTGWQTIDGERYYLGDDGAMVTGWLEQDGGRMYLNEAGNPYTGWLELEEGTYYLDENSFMQTGWQEIGENRYYLDESGIMQTGWQEIGENCYYLNESGIMQTGWQEIGENCYYLNESGIMQTGWQEIGENCYYLDESGIMQTGWQEIGENRYYLDESGIMQTGWLELNGQAYYLKEDGTAAKGKLVIDGETFYFTSRGAQVILVNRWNPLPETFQPEVVEVCSGFWMAESCAEITKTMLTDLENAVGGTGLLSGYRSYATQYKRFYSCVQDLVAEGSDFNTAYNSISCTIAIPGTSEHQLGMALDILGYTDYYYKNGENDVIRWMKEHCWEYGFILRYPEEKRDITGIIYEPWHFRYVGVELAMELKDSGLCLEEYLDNLTNDGTTCGNPSARSAK